MIAPDSKIVIGVPPPFGSVSTMAGIRPLGDILRNAAVS